MPFAGQIGAVATRAQLVRNGHDAVVQMRLITRFAEMFRRNCLRHIAQTRAVVDHAGLQHRPRWGARPCHMEVRKTNALGGKRVDIGRRNLSAEGPDITKAPIIGQ